MRVRNKVLLRLTSLTWINRTAAFLGGSALLAMALLGASDVVLGRFFGAPVRGTLELTETLMVCAVFLAIALAQEEKRHIRVEVLVKLLPLRAQALCNIIGLIVTLGVFGLIAWYGWSMAAYSIEAGQYQAGAIRLPLWPAKIALACGATLMVIQVFRDIILAVSTLVWPSTGQAGT